MTVQVRLFATLAQFLPPGGHGGSAMLDVPEGSTVGELTKRLGIPAGLDRVILLNGREAEPAEPLRPGDAIDIFPPLAGGGESVR